MQLIRSLDYDSFLSVDFPYLYFGEPYLLNHPLISRRRTPNITEQRVDIPPFGEAKTLHLKPVSSSSFTSVAMAERVRFVDTKIYVEVTF